VLAFERLGYEIVRQKGSHVRMRCSGRTPLTVPLRKEMKPGTLRSLIAESGFTIEEFVNAL
jgi:predicted RNA binding protein YcfA (HicA-like mRNA interferase family)